jgi:hypothetical protein
VSYLRSKAVAKNGEQNQDGSVYWDFASMAYEP